VKEFVFLILVVVVVYFGVKNPKEQKHSKELCQLTRRKETLKAKLKLIKRLQKEGKHFNSIDVKHIKSQIREVEEQIRILLRKAQ